MSEPTFDELPRWVDIAIAEHLLGLKVERKTVRTTPGDRLYGHEVTFFIEPDGSPMAGMVRWTYDDGACNFIAWRNGRDETDGNAPPLPHFVSGLFDSSEVMPLIEMLRERRIYVQITPHPRGYVANAWDGLKPVGDTGSGAEPPQAVGRVLLHLLRERHPKGFYVHGDRNA